jgi:hypothetical protein
MAGLVPAIHVFVGCPVMDVDARHKAGHDGPLLKIEEVFVLAGVPLMIVPLAIYNIVAFLTPGLSFTAPLTSVRMVSGTEWPITAGDILLVVALVVLFIEIVKATRTGSRSIVDHMLSTLIFIIALVEFLLVPQAATSVFALLMIITLMDVVAGYTVSIRTAQRDYSVERIEPLP